MSRPPIVSDADRDYAMSQIPPWCQRGDIGVTGEIVDDGGWLEDAQARRDGGLEKPIWSVFVAEEIEKFEQHYAGEYRHSSEWSSIWRKGWWPKVSARKRFPKSAPKEFQPFFRAGTAEFTRALKVARADEKRIWVRFGIAQFKPDDPRLAVVRGPEKSA